LTVGSGRRAQRQADPGMSGIAVARLVRALPGARESRESPDSPGLHGSRSSQRGWTKHL
jgi:hypothetical protein